MESFHVIIKPEDVRGYRLRTDFDSMPEDAQTLSKGNIRSKSGYILKKSEGAEMYSMSTSKFMQKAKDARACYKVNQLVLVNLDIIDEYLETFHIVEEEFYK